MQSNHKQYPRIGVGVIVLNKNKVLLGKRKGAHGEGDWAFPGGHLEHLEEVEACAARELKEETGLNALSLTAGPWVNNIMEGTKHYVTLFVIVDKFEGEVQLLEPHKSEEWQWFEWSALPSPLFPPIQSLIEKKALTPIVSTNL